MKNWKHWAFVAVIAIVGIIMGFAACDKDNGTTAHTHEWGEWTVTTPATATTEGVETRTCKTCGEKETRPIEQTEPTKKDFTINFLFQNPGDPNFSCDATIIDQRTNCGSQNLEQLKVNDKNIVTIIEEAIQGSFNTKTTGNATRNVFRKVFKDAGNSVTVYVENTATAYKIKATDVKTIYFHIDYLKSSPADIQQNIFDAVSAMNTGGSSLPYNAE